MAVPPLLQSELSFTKGGPDSLRECLRERRKTRFRRIGDWMFANLLLPVVHGLFALIESAEPLRFIPASVWSGVSFLISVVVFSFRLGWGLSAGFMTLLLIHECGHLLAARWYRAPMSVPLFIPYLGAIIDMKQPMRNAWEEAVFGISGPILGSLGAFACLGIHHLTGSFFFAELALFGFFLNLFNLIPIGFLDGGHIAVALSRWLWIPGYLMMAAFVWFIHSPAAILVLVVMLPMVLSLFRRKPGKSRLPHSQDYDRVSILKRTFMGTLYVGLIAILVASMVLVWCREIVPGIHAGYGFFHRSTSGNTLLPSPWSS